ncbi:glucagon receptor isoform X2 [Trichomycterus rosablanca]|uniref:glucagon receptor isoform X2 n=1 Tax=Trichomycterus rosablanca TaxID=2290929 RepID=UPI002F3521C9
MHAGQMGCQTPQSKFHVPGICPGMIKVLAAFVHNGFVLRECGPDGQWHTNNTSPTWRDHSQCNADVTNHKEQENKKQILVYFRVMYTVGYSLSLISLSLAFIIILVFRKLRCNRNYVHANLFASFILRALSVLIRDALLTKDLPQFRNSSDVSSVFSDQALPGCRIALVITQYCVGANYFWLLVEGLYLHNLLVLIAFSENSYFCAYIFLGWGTPVLFVVPWIVMRLLYENTRCWEINDNLTIWWIIRGSTLLAIFVNFFFFIRIIQILISKLKAHQMRYTDYRFRLAKSTLTLIPLLGIHEVVFAVMRGEQTEGVLPYTSLFFELFFNSFQGFLVAVLYCFVNKEVQSEIKKKWHRWKLGMSILDDQRNTGSHTLQGVSGLQHQHDQPCQLNYPEEGESNQCLEPQMSSVQLSLNQGKVYCYISNHKQVLNGNEMEMSVLGHCELEGANGCSDSCC